MPYKCDSQTQIIFDNLTKDIVIAGQYFSSIEVYYLKTGKQVLHASHLNNLKDAMQHYRKLYQLVYIDEATSESEKEILRQIAYIGEHLTRLGIDMIVDLLQYHMSILSQAILVIKKGIEKYHYKKILELVGALETLTPILHEGKELLHKLRFSKVDSNRIFDFMADSGFSEAFQCYCLQAIDIIKQCGVAYKSTNTTRVYETIQRKSALI